MRGEPAAAGRQHGRAALGLCLAWDGKEITGGTPSLYLWINE